MPQETPSVMSKDGRAPNFIVRVVSFADAFERRERFATMMAQFEGVDWEFHDVVPAEGLPVDYDEGTAFRIGGSTLSLAEISCAASHLTLMQKFLKVMKII